MLDRLFNFFSSDVGIDLGTANTLVFVKGKGIVIREPSVVAIHRKTKKVLAIGTEAKKMIGKTPQSILTVRPLKGGVIADFDATEAMIKFYIRQESSGKNIECVGFKLGKYADDFRHKSFDMAFTAEENNWKGNVTYNLSIRDVKFHE